jgi:hypothetical protein
VALARQVLESGDDQGVVTTVSFLGEVGEARAEKFASVSLALGEEFRLDVGVLVDVEDPVRERQLVRLDEIGGHNIRV